MPILPDNSSRRGITLIETLIGIMLITVLIALLFGALHRVRENSQNIKCLTNLRALGAGALAFFADRNGELLPTKFWYSASWDAKPGLRDYLGITSSEKSSSAIYMVDTVFTCPRLKAMFPERFPSFLNRTYSVNYYLHIRDPSTAYNSDESSRPLLNGAPHRLANIPKPSAMWMFTDGSATETSDFHTSSKRGYVTNYMFFPHNGRQNVVFMDGHVESLSLKEFQNPPNLREFWGDLNL